MFGLNCTSEAIACWQEARTVAESIGSWRILWQILAALTEAEEAHGHADLAADLRQEARTTLKHVIEYIPEGELRTSFVALPAVRQLLPRR